MSDDAGGRWRNDRVMGQAVQNRTRTHKRDPWVGWLRRMVLREIQIRASLETHGSRLHERLRTRYATLLRLSEARLRALEAALVTRGESPGGWAASVVRVAGHVTGVLTSFGGERRILSMDIDGVRRLERGYFEASQDKPPVDISCALCGFIGPLESERAGLVEDARPLFESRSSS